MPRLVRRMPLSMEEGGMGDGDGDEYDGQRPQAKVEGGFSRKVLALGRNFAEKREVPLTLDQPHPRTWNLDRKEGRVRGSDEFDQNDRSGPF
jgi:hypothetical protein